MMQNYDFINEPTKKALFRMFLPMMIGMLLNFAYNIVDTLWVGNLMGDTALAALTNATPIVTLTYSFVKRNNISYNMSLPVWRAIFLPCPKKPYSAGFAAMQ